jgi:hypothetical protein
VREERDKESDEAQNDSSDSSSSSSTTAAVARSIHIVTRLTSTLGETALELLLTAGVATLAQVTDLILMMYDYASTVVPVPSILVPLIKIAAFHDRAAVCTQLSVPLLILKHTANVSDISAKSIICSGFTDTAYDNSWSRGQMPLTHHRTQHHILTQ